MNRYQIFTNESVAADVVPAITIDHNERLVGGIGVLQTVLGITEMEPVPAGNVINVYKMVKYNTPDQPAEGADIALTEIKRQVANSYNMTIKKYRKATTAEAIQKSGREVAINKSDDKLILEIQKDIKSSLFSALQPGSGTTSADAGSTFQAALANVWAKAAALFEDDDVDMVYFANPADVAGYLGTASITVQTAFGVKYIEDFMGLGTVIISSGVTQYAPFGTPKQNLNGAYAPINGDVASQFNLTADATGLVGMVHTPNTTNASIETMALTNVVFFPEAVNGIVKGSITH